MIRQHENTVSVKAGALSVAVHGVLLVALLISFNWKTTHPVSIAEVELWDGLPNQQIAKPLPLPEIKPEPKIEPTPIPPEVEPKVEPPEPKVEPKAEITVKKAEPKVEKPKEVKKPDQLAELQKKLRQEELAQKEADALKKLQQEMLGDSEAPSKPTKPSAALAGELDKYKAQIQRKIQGKVIKTLCGDGNPELVFDIALMPTGMLQGQPKLVKSSNIGACDDAVERAILQSEPLPLPDDPSLKSQFRNLRLQFRPNE